MAEPLFTGVIEDAPDRIVFQRRDGGRYTSPRTPASEKLAGSLPRAAESKLDPAKVDDVLATSPRVAQMAPWEASSGMSHDPQQGGKSEAPKPAPAPASAPMSVDPQQGGMSSVAEGPPVTFSSGPEPTGPRQAMTPSPGLQVAPEVRQQQAAQAEAQAKQRAVQERAAWLASPEGRQATAIGEAGAPVVVPYSPGVTQQQLQQKATTGTLVPTRGGMRVEGAKPVPDEYIKAREAAFQQQEQIADDELQANERLRQAQIAEQERRATEIGDEMRAQEQAKVDLQARRKQREDQLAQADQELTNWQENPLRIYGEKGTFSSVAAQVAAVLGQALGAYGAILGGGPNFAMEMVNAAVERDVQAQRAEYMAKKDASNNLVSRLNLILGDIDSATAKAKDLQLAAAQNYGDQLALSTKRDDVMLAWQKTRAQIQEQRLATHLALIDRASGNVTVTSEGAMQYPRGPSGGYTRKPTSKEFNQRLAGIQERQDRLAAIGGQPTSETQQKMAVEGAKAEAKAAAASAASPAEKMAYAKFRSAVTEGETSLKTLRAVVDKHKDKWSIPGHGFEQPVYWMTEEGTQVNSAKEKALANYVKAISGAAATDNERDNLRRALFGFRDTTLREGLEFMENDLKRRGSALDAIMKGTGAPEAYDANIAEAARAWQSQGNEGVGPAAVSMLIQRARRETGVEIEE